MILLFASSGFEQNYTVYDSVTLNNFLKLSSFFILLLLPVILGVLLLQKYLFYFSAGSQVLKKLIFCVKPPFVFHLPLFPLFWK